MINADSLQSAEQEVASARAELNRLLDAQGENGASRYIVRVGNSNATGWTSRNPSPTEREEDISESRFSSVSEDDYAIRDLGTPDINPNSPGVINELSRAVALTGFPLVTLGDQSEQRSYVYTWVTQFGEESIASEPSDSLIVQGGQRVEVNGLPMDIDEGVLDFGGEELREEIGGIRLYRTVSTTDNAEYFRVETLWWRDAVMKWEWNIDDNEDVWNGKVDGEAANGDGDAIVVGKELKDGQFTDSLLQNELTDLLVTDDYDAPPEGLKGLRLAHNNILVGFKDNEVYFSEPDTIHAWPDRHKITLEHTVTHVEPLSGKDILVLTDSYPFLINGSSPQAMQITRFDTYYPCPHRKTVVPMKGGVAWMTHTGVAFYAAQTLVLVTLPVWDETEWQSKFDLNSFLEFGATWYDGKYMFWDDRVERYLLDFSIPSGNSQGSAQLITYSLGLDAHPTAFTQHKGDTLFRAAPMGEQIRKWGGGSDKLRWTWRSKKFTPEKPISIGCGIIYADDTPGHPTDTPYTVCIYTEQAITNDNPEGLLHDIEVAPDCVFRLPAGQKYDDFSIEVSGLGHMKSIRLAETPMGLGSV